MNLTKLGLAAAFGYVVGTFPTRELAARMAAGRQDVTVSDVDPEGHEPRGWPPSRPSWPRPTIGCVGGLRLAGPLGLAVAGVAGAAGDRFPIWRLVKRKRNHPPAVSG